MKKKLTYTFTFSCISMLSFRRSGSDSSKESDKKTEASSDKKDTTDTKRMSLKKRRLFSNQKLMKLIASLLTWITLL